MRVINKRILGSLLAGAMVLVVTPAWAADIAGNGGFETAGSNAFDSDQWTEFADVHRNTLSYRLDAIPASGTWAHVIQADGDNTAGASAGVNQNSIADVGLPSLQENTTVTVTAEIRAGYQEGGVGFGVVRILNGAGDIVADSGLQSLPNTVGVYQSYTLPTVTVPAFGAPPNDVYAAFVEFSVAAGAVDNSVGQAFIDDVVIDATLVGAQPVSAASDISLFVMLLLFAAALGYFALRNSTSATAA